MNGEAARIVIYQMNFVVPPVSSGIRRCDAAIQPNFVATYNEGITATNIAFCVEP